MLRCVITNRTRYAGDEQERQTALLHNAERWATDGLDLIQLREKDLAAGALALLARKLLATLRAPSSAPAPKLLINSRADVAIAVGADGVHLTAAPGELTPSQVRLLYAAAGLPDPIVSVSCHTLAEISRARDADLILFGPVFEKVTSDGTNDTKPTATGSGLELLRAACTTAAPVPVLALGGITESNTAACLAAGAAGIAAIRLFTG